MAGDLYPNYETLKRHEEEGVDYAIRTYPVQGSMILAMAPHGGGIEAGTSEMVQELNNRFSFAGYEFDAMKSSGNNDLHITSTNFDEPIAVKMVNNVFHSISLHGYGDDVKGTYVGGADLFMLDIVADELDKAGFSVNTNPPGYISGTDPDNIINRNRRGKGVQLELSTAQREAFFTNDDFSRSNRDNRVQEFYDYVNALGKAMLKGYKLAPTRSLKAKRFLYPSRLL